MMEDSAAPVFFSSEEYKVCVRLWLQEKSWIPRGPLQVPPLCLFLLIDALWTGQGMHLQGLIAGMWTSQ